MFIVQMTKIGWIWESLFELTVNTKHLHKTSNDDISGGAFFAKIVNCVYIFCKKLDYRSLIESEISLWK